MGPAEDATAAAPIGDTAVRPFTRKKPVRAPVPAQLPLPSLPNYVTWPRTVGPNQYPHLTDWDPEDREARLHVQRMDARIKAMETKLDGLKALKAPTEVPLKIRISGIVPPVIGATPPNNACMAPIS